MLLTHASTAHERIGSSQMRLHLTDASTAHTRVYSSRTHLQLMEAVQALPQTQPKPQTQHKHDSITNAPDAQQRASAAETVSATLDTMAASCPGHRDTMAASCPGCIF